MKVTNVTTSQPEDLDAGDLAIGLASGTHEAPAGQGVLFNPRGELVFTPADQVSEAVTKYGYKIPQPEELKSLGESYKYQTGLSQAEALGAGVARGATFGLSDFLATKTGLANPETLQKLKEFNPGLSMTGELAGAVGTALIPGSLVARVMKGARGIEAATQAALSAALPAEGMAGKIAQLAVETGAKGLGGAIEGAAFGLGQTVSEASLGDPDLTAQKVMANIGHGAFLGGALNAAVVPGRVLFKKAIEKARGAYDTFYEKMIGKVVPAETVAPAEAAAGEAAAEAAAGPVTVKNPTPDMPEGTTVDVTQEIPEPKLFKAEAEAPTETFEPGYFTKAQAKIKSLLTGESENDIIQKIQKDMSSQYMTAKEAEIVHKDLYESVRDLHSQLEKASRKASAVRPQEIENLLVDADITAPAAESERVGRNILNVADAMSNEDVAYRYDQGIVKDLKRIGEGLLKNREYFENAGQHFKAINEVKQMIDEIAQTGQRDLLAMPRTERNATLLVRELNADFRKSLENESVWGQAAARQQAYNRAISDYIAATGKNSFFKKYFLVKKGANYVVDPTKTTQFVRFVNSARGMPRNQGLEEFLEKSKSLLDEIENTFKNVPQEDLDVGAIKDFVNKASDTAIKSRDFAASHAGGLGYVTDMMQQAMKGNLGAAAAGFLKGIADPSMTVQTLSNIEKQAAKTSKFVDRVSKAIFEKVRPVAKGAGVILKETPKERTDRYNEAVKKIQDLSMAPDTMLDQLEGATREAFPTAPKISQALQMASVRAISFLGSKIPQHPHKAPLDQPYEPSQAEMLKFMRYYDTVENPLVVLEQLENNNIHPETIETLQSVHPQLLSDIQAQVMTSFADKMNEPGFKVPYQQRVMLSKFLGTSLDSTMKPEIIARNQMTLAQLQGQKAAEEQAQQGAVRPSQTGLGKVSLANRSQSNLDKVISRRA